MPELESRNTIGLWLCYYATIADPTLLAALAAPLNAAEREQQGRFHFADDRLRFLVTRAMVRTVLSRYAPVAPAAWTFDRNAYGRPAVAACHDAGDLQFNVSHSRGLIALAVTRGRMLGVDVENTVLRQAAPDVAEQFFAPAEVAALAQLPEALRAERFFALWTLKESYIKARGMGLSLPLDQFSFDFPGDGQLQLNVAPALGDDGQCWHFWQCRPSPDYLLALCAARGTGPAPAIVARTLMPMRAHETSVLTWLRTERGR
jgi:4'-phosphopantetheinyl transferase